MERKFFIIKAAMLLAASLIAVCAHSQDADWTPQVHGTLRSKYELKTTDWSQRFEVRTARLSVSGNVTPIVSYKAEIDLCDEGNIKMLDAYTRITPAKGLSFTIGQMRVPFTIDAHRSPHQQYFANRSFIAKQVGNVRDVGAQVSYAFGEEIPVTVTAGLFNGSGLTNQKNFWTNTINYSGKVEVKLPHGFNLLLSAQKICPDSVDVHLFDAGINYHAGRWHIEAEYLLKHYAEDAFSDVNAMDAFVCYSIPLKGERSPFRAISPLVRFDYMGDHSDGTRTGGVLTIDDYERSRLTGGVTISLGKKFQSDIRINYEKYFYDEPSHAKVSENDKFVIEFMTHF